MHRLWLIVLLLFAFIVPSTAQEDEGGCQIDLLDAIAALAAAQSSAAAGDLAAALETIASVQENLAEIVAACGESAAQISLPQSFVAKDGLLRFSYPEGWALLSPSEGVNLIGSSQDVVNELFSSNLDSPLPAGNQVMIVAATSYNEVNGADTFDELVERFQEDGLGSIDATILPGQTHFRDYAARYFRLVSPLLTGQAIIADLGGDKALIVMGLAPIDEEDLLNPIFEAVTASIQYGIPAGSGKSLDELRYTSGISLRDLIPDVSIGFMQSAMLSPDGSMIAGLDRVEGDFALCLYVLADANLYCNPLPELAGRPAVLLWSQDSQQIALLADIRLLDDGDIWVFDVETAVFTNRTDDNINDWRIGRDFEGTLWLDFAATWGPQGDLYFMRSEIATEGSRISDAPYSLYHLPADSDQAELVRDLTGEIEALSVYIQGNTHYLDGTMAVSPDGEQIALIVLTRQLDDPASGIYIMPLSGDAPLRQIAQTSNLTAGSFQDGDEEVFFLPFGLSWTPDASGLFVFAYNPSIGASSVPVLYHIDIASGQISPLTDFSDVTVADSFRIDPETGLSPSFYTPRSAAISPDGASPVVFHFAAAEPLAGLTAYVLEDGVYQPRTLIESFEFDRLPTDRASAGSDGTLLIFGYLFVPEQ